MKIAIAGHSGFIGTALINVLSNHEIVRINRSDLYSDKSILKDKLINSDIVINLAGAPISKRWNQKNKELIKRSRVLSTKNIVKSINSIENQSRPQMLIQASAIGIYDENGLHDESSINYGNNFLSEVVRLWESETEKLDETVERAVIRIGLVLDKDKGAIAKMEPLFQIGLGAILGSGKQKYPFIHIDDVTAGIMFIMENKLSGIINLTNPNSITNRKFSKEFAKALKRPLLFKIPEFVMNIIMGESSIIVTKGQNVVPNKLLNSGYIFKYDDIRKVFLSFYESN